MNSSVTSRPTPASDAARAVGVSFTRRPAASHSTSYSGTSAKPKAKLPATISPRLRVSERSILRSGGASFMAGVRPAPSSRRRR